MLNVVYYRESSQIVEITQKTAKWGEKRIMNEYYALNCMTPFFTASLKIKDRYLNPKAALITS